MESLREKHEETSPFFKRIITRCNKLYKMFGYGRGHSEYVGHAKELKLKALESVTFSTTRFFSSSYQQWIKIYESYKALIEAFTVFREDAKDDCEETKYQVLLFFYCCFLYHYTCINFLK